IEVEVAEGLRPGLDPVEHCLPLPASRPGRLQPEIEVGAEPPTAEPALGRQSPSTSALHLAEVPRDAAVAVDRPRRLGKRLEPERERTVGALEEAAAPWCADVWEPLEEFRLVRAHFA